jgi:hypothetical protein
MLPGHVVAAVMVREATRRRLSEPPREPRRRVRRVTARALYAAARRLDRGTAAQRSPLGA